MNSSSYNQSGLTISASSNEPSAVPLQYLLSRTQSRLAGSPLIPLLYFLVSLFTSLFTMFACPRQLWDPLPSDATWFIPQYDPSILGAAASSKVPFP